MSHDSASDCPDFETLKNLFHHQGALISPAELQAFLCGQLSAGRPLKHPAFLEVAAEQLGLENIREPELEAAIQAMLKNLQARLDAPGFDLQLVLPAGEAPLDHRATALGEWCQGFLRGYTLAGGLEAERLGEDAAEALEDFAEIARIGVEEQTEGAEADFAEVEEYVRMAALLVFSVCNRGGSGDAAPAGAALH